MSKNHETPICPSNIDIVKKYVNTAEIVFEVGAYDGVDIHNIKKLWDNPAVHAFEPDPEHFELLNKNYSDVAVCNNLGLFNKEGEITLYKLFDKAISNDAELQKNRNLWHKTAQSVYHINHHTDLCYEHPIQIKVTTVDDYCKKHNIVPDIILMDTQGSEPDILEGAANILNNKKLKAIMLEWSSEELYIGQKKLSYIEALLNHFGFKMVEKINLWVEKHGDAIFVRND